MFDEYIQGRTLRRLARFSCSIVSLTWDHWRTTNLLWIKGVLDRRLSGWGSWWSTRNKAISKCHWSTYSRSIILQTTSLMNTESNRDRNNSHDCFLLHFSCSIHVVRCYADWPTSRSPQLHHYWQRIHCYWWDNSSSLIFSSSDYCGSSALCKSDISMDRKGANETNLWQGFGIAVS